MTEEPTAVERLIGDFAPKLVELTGDVLFGDIWERPGLSKRDRSLVVPRAAMMPPFPVLFLYRPFHYSGEPI